MRHRGCRKSIHLTSCVADLHRLGALENFLIICIELAILIRRCFVAGYKLFLPRQLPLGHSYGADINILK